MQYWGKALGSQAENLVSYDVEPFLPSLFSHGTPSAYPPDRTKGLLPLNLYFAWSSSFADQAYYNAIKTSAAYIKQLAIAEGQDIEDAALYGNYVLYDTPLESIYGDNVARLKAIHAQYDPQNVMGLAGGFKF